MQADKLRLRIGKLRARRDTADSLCEQFERGEALRRRCVHGGWPAGRTRCVHEVGR